MKINFKYSLYNLYKEGGLVIFLSTLLGLLVFYYGDEGRLRVIKYPVIIIFISLMIIGLFDLFCRIKNRNSIVIIEDEGIEVNAYSFSLGPVNWGHISSYKIIEHKSGKIISFKIKSKYIENYKNNVTNKIALISMFIFEYSYHSPLLIQFDFLKKEDESKLINHLNKKISFDNG